MRIFLVVSATLARKHRDPCRQQIDFSNIEEASSSMVLMWHLRQLRQVLQDCEYRATEIEGNCADHR
jgi:hypothetical protein